MKFVCLVSNGQTKSMKERPRLSRGANKIVSTVKVEIPKPRQSKASKTIQRTAVLKLTHSRMQQSKINLMSWRSTSTRCIMTV